MTPNPLSSQQSTSVSDPKTPSIQFIKQESTETSIFLNHCFDNQAPLWCATDKIKQEINQSQVCTSRTYLSALNLPSQKIKKQIRKQITLYKQLSNEEREQYLEQRMALRKHDGSIIPALKDQNEVIATRKIPQWELLGHYAGKYFTDEDYNQGAGTVGAPLITVDRYSVSASKNIFISGFRHGNIISCINAYRIYSSTEKEDELPKQNVSFIKHVTNQGITILFIIATKEIKEGDILWLDYGEAYWKASNAIIEISDNDSSEDNATPNKQKQLDRSLTATEKIDAILKNKVEKAQASLVFVDLNPSSSTCGIKGKYFQCSECGKKVPHRNDYKRHLLIHTGEKPFKCQEKNCGQMFNHPSNLKRHLRAHTGDKPYSCSVVGCNKKYSQKSSLTGHLLTHAGEKNHKCPVSDCDKAFSLESSLKKHLKLHSRGKTYHCPFIECHMSFKREQDLKRHQLKHTGERPFPCQAPECGKYFFRKEHLKKHMLMHIEETEGETYQCQISNCNKAFNQKFALKKHMQTHTGYRQYQCQFTGCLSSFNRKQELNRHKLTHTGEKPYSCQILGCNKAFSRKYNLILHWKTHTKEKSLQSRVKSTTATPFACSPEPNLVNKQPKQDAKSAEPKPEPKYPAATLAALSAPKVQTDQP